MAPGAGISMLINEGAFANHEADGFEEGLKRFGVKAWSLGGCIFWELNITATASFDSI